MVLKKYFFTWTVFHAAHYFPTLCLGTAFLLVIMEGLLKINIKKRCFVKKTWFSTRAVKPNLWRHSQHVTSLILKQPHMLRWQRASLFYRFTYLSSFTQFLSQPTLWLAKARLLVRIEGVSVFQFRY